MPVKEQTPWAEAIPLNIVFEDNDILVIDKPSTSSCIGSEYNSTLANALLHMQISHLPHTGGSSLEQDTTGLLISAKTIGPDQLIKSMREREIRRHYQAILQGIIISGGSIDEPIGRHNIENEDVCLQWRKSGCNPYLVEKRFAAHTIEPSTKPEELIKFEYTWL